MSDSTHSQDQPPVQGEGDYEAARRYRQKLTDFVNRADVDQLAKSASVQSPKDARDFRARRSIRTVPLQGDDPADVDVMYHQQTRGGDRSVAEKAYELWQARGCPHGSAELDWYEAERLLANSGQSASSSIDESGVESFPASDPPATRSRDEPPSNANDKWRNDASLHLNRGGA